MVWYGMHGYSCIFVTHIMEQYTSNRKKNG